MKNEKRSLEHLLSRIDKSINEEIKTTYNVTLNPEDIRICTIEWIETTYESGYLYETIDYDFEDNDTINKLINKYLKKV